MVEVGRNAVHVMQACMVPEYEDILNEASAFLDQDIDDEFGPFNVENFHTQIPPFCFSGTDHIGEYKEIRLMRGIYYACACMMVLLHQPVKSPSWADKYSELKSNQSQGLKPESHYNTMNVYFTDNEKFTFPVKRIKSAPNSPRVSPGSCPGSPVSLCSSPVVKKLKTLELEEQEPEQEVKKEVKQKVKKQKKQVKKVKKTL